MSTLAEVEAAVDKLSSAEQKVLLQYIAERVHRSDALAGDPVAAVIGAFRSGHHATSEDAEDILYGHDSNR